MLGGLVIGFVVGVVVGVLLALAAVRSRSRPAGPEEPAGGPRGQSIAPEPALAEPIPGPDDEVRQAIDATAGLLDDLETRYRNRPAPAGEDDEPAARPPRPRRPRRS